MRLNQNQLAAEAVSLKVDSGSFGLCLVDLVSQAINLSDPQFSHLNHENNATPNPSCENSMRYCMWVVSTWEALHKHWFLSASLLTPSVCGFAHPQPPRRGQCDTGAESCC